MTATFEQSKAYQQKEEVFFDDGREIELLHQIYGHPDVEQIRNDPTAVLAQIDRYGRTAKYLMNVGEDKGRIVSSLIEEVQPRVMLELGGYVGYSTILFGSAAKRASATSGAPTRYYCLERNPEFGAVIMSLVDLAGLSDVVKVVVGPSDAGIRRLHAEGKLGNGVDMMFLDHFKPAYTTDLKLCEDLGVIRAPSAGRRGTVLAADNVIEPGNPPYLEYVRSTTQEKKEALSSNQASGVNEVDKRFRDRTAKQYERREGEEKLSQTVRGNPRLKYQSKLVHSFEPTGVKDGIEVTECVGEELD